MGQSLFHHDRSCTGTDNNHIIFFHIILLMIDLKILPSFRSDKIKKGDRPLFLGNHQRNGGGMA
jgi:hypothetical protein